MCANIIPHKTRWIRQPWPPHREVGDSEKWLPTVTPEMSPQKLQLQFEESQVF